MKVETVIEKAFHKANLIGTHVDIYEVIESYKTLSVLPESEKDKIYDKIAGSMGLFSKGTYCLVDKVDLIHALSTVK
ncbi:hypothetical protein [Paenibacillus periandrae]|uniref:hypothetical protein n=1 Tax=Paenibacillus periandrae TaxID=1761741 RepID=UPI001F089E1D|nr:hypothetical protein [Paenibacillus periandrae]